MKRRAIQNRTSLAYLCVGNSNRSNQCLLRSRNLKAPSFSEVSFRRRTFSTKVIAVEESDTEAEEVSIEEQYSRKTPLEHVLLRPSMYVGPNERSAPTPCWVPDPIPETPSEDLIKDPLNVETKCSTEGAKKPLKMVRKEYGIVPALIKIFDEILVNASDNRLRDPHSCKRIDVTIDPGSENRDPFIRVRNDGKGIPVEVHKKEGMYVPEMLFGNLLTGSNFNDSEKRLTGGRHGYGAKLANIFSKTFTVETFDSQRDARFRQTWSNNMKEKFNPEITRLDNGGSDYTSVTFVPDLPRLTGDSMAYFILPEDYSVMCRRVIDVAGCAAGNLEVTLNGHDVSFSTWEDYIQRYRTEDSKPICFRRLNPRWNVGVALSDGGVFDTVSFVNGIATSRGGTHVNAIVQQLARTIIDSAKKIDPEAASMVTHGLVRRNMFVAVDCLIENPTFDSQMKECLTSNQDTFGSSFEIPRSFLRGIVQPEEDGGPGIVEEVIRMARGRQQAALMKNVGGKRTRRQLLAIPKLEDAHKAGTESGCDCTLILTEGDSAKALAVAGLEVIGREHNGVFPLRGKFLNVRGASPTKLEANAEVKALCAIIGLEFEKTYSTKTERRELRYGKVMLMTDQDNDGSHIKGLVMNFFRHFWPDLLRPPIDVPPEEAEFQQSFLSYFVTPLLKVSKKGTKGKSLSFFSAAEYNAWRQNLEPAEIKKWNVKYYKGLGTSTPAVAKAYFSSFDDHFRPFRWQSENDGELLDMVFDKERAADRRGWILEEYDEAADVCIEKSNGNSVTYEDFVNKEMIHFSHADNIRSVPSMIDGLKPSQRKVLFACFKRKLRSEIKVAQLTGYCAEHSAYHHGEASLQSTSKWIQRMSRNWEFLHFAVIGMAQDFVGSNNINMLVPSGQFGTRIMGGADAASPRYIFTHLSPITRYLFPEADDCLLNYLEDDGLSIEPEFYCPIIPLLIVNGTQGIGTGWSTFIPSHDPKDVVNYIRAKLDDSESLPPIRPFARGFTGRIEPHPSGPGYISFGRATAPKRRIVQIDELPIGCWTAKYKEMLLLMRNKGMITSFVENHTTTKVSFTVTVPPVKLDKMKKSGLEKQFKLSSTLRTSNMHAFGANQQMIKFETVEDIADAYFPYRLRMYEDRMSVLRSNMNYESTLMQNKARFIKSVTDGDIDLITGRQSQEATAARLVELGFDSGEKLRSIKNNNALGRRYGDATTTLAPKEEKEGPDFEYLLNMPLSSLTRERIDGLRSDASKKDIERKRLENLDPKDLWVSELDTLESALQV